LKRHYQEKQKKWKSNLQRWKKFEVRNIWNRRNAKLTSKQLQMCSDVTYDCSHLKTYFPNL
jgi:hypothetical protein